MAMSLLASCGQIDSEVKLVRGHSSLYKVIPDPQLLYTVELKAGLLRAIGKKLKLIEEFSIALATEYNELLIEMAADIEQVESDFIQALSELPYSEQKQYPYVAGHFGDWLIKISRTIIEGRVTRKDLKVITSEESINQFNFRDRVKLNRLLAKIPRSSYEVSKQINKLHDRYRRSLEFMIWGSTNSVVSEHSPIAKETEKILTQKEYTQWLKDQKERLRDTKLFGRLIELAQQAKK